MIRNKKNKKAQIWALDLAIGLMVFAGIIFMFYRYSVSFVPEQTTLQKMIRQGGLISDSLLSEGYPPDWAEKENINDVYMFGLLSNKLLNETKWAKFCEWSNSNYRVVKEKMGAGFNSFYIFFDKDNDNIGEAIANCNETGKTPPDDARQIVKIERLVAYNESGVIIPMKMILYLWSYQKT